MHPTCIVLEPAVTTFDGRGPTALKTMPILPAIPYVRRRCPFTQFARVPEK